MASDATLLVSVLLAAYAALILWRVDAEKGWVGISDFQRTLLRFKGDFTLLERTIGEALLPAIRAATDAMLRFGEALRKTKRVA